MNREEVIMLCTCDLAGQVRGKGFPVSDLAVRLKKGIGWTPTNSMITAHGPIAPSPWGPYGDTVLAPDEATRIRVDFAGEATALHFMMADIRNLDGSPWSVCPRGFLKRMVTELAARHHLKIKAAFEHEFTLEGVDERPNASYALDSFRRQGTFAELYLGALKEAKIELDTFMPEYGPKQYEITVGPAEGVTAADRAIAVREIGRSVAHRLGTRASFTPILRPGAVGNGVHVHFSLLDATSNAPVNHDPQAPNEVSQKASAFIAGLLRLMPAITAVTAPSTISYLRLTPNRWSAAYNNFGRQDREAGVRICPVFPGAGGDISQQFHFEFRAADSAASPYLALGAILAAGVYGLDQSLPQPKICPRPPQDMKEEERKALDLVRLPQSLDEALDCLAEEDALRPLFGLELIDAYLAHKRFEASMMRDLSLDDQCERYRLAY
jgi:glutamine synthetase